MNVAMFSSKPYDREFFGKLNQAHGHKFEYFEPHLTPATAKLAGGYSCVCAFVNDTLNKQVLSALESQGVRLIALRCAGFNNVDLPAARELKLTVVRVPAYSPYAVAEHAMALILELNRKLHRAYNRVRDGNFALDGLLGFDLHGTTVGVIGTGKIGQVFCSIIKGFGVNLLAYDPYPSQVVKDLGGNYVSLDEIFAQSDVISLHTPLTTETNHLINAKTLSKMKRGVMLINTSRGALIQTADAIEALKTGQLGYLGLDVYEEESELFFEDLSGEILHDDVFARLLTFPNVIVTGHQAFFTKNALENIAGTTLSNITAYEKGQPLANEVK